VTVSQGHMSQTADGVTLAAPLCTTFNQRLLSLMFVVHSGCSTAGILTSVMSVCDDPPHQLLSSFYIIPQSSMKFNDSILIADPTV